MTDLTKEKVAAISASVAAHMVQQRSPEPAPSLSEIQSMLQQLLGKVSQLEKRIDELDSTIKQTKKKVR